MQSLAPELVLSIFSHLHAEDLLNCSLVCRQWFEITTDALLWYNICREYHVPTLQRVPQSHLVVYAPNSTNKTQHDNTQSPTNLQQQDAEAKHWFRQVDWRLEYRWRAMGKIPVRPVMHSTSRQTFSVHAVAYDQDSELVVTVDDDGFLKYWRPEQEDEGLGRYSLNHRIFMNEDYVANMAGLGGANRNRSLSFCNNLGMCVDTGIVYSSVGSWLQKRDLETGRIISHFPVTLDPNSFTFVTSILPWSPHSSDLVVTGTSNHFVDLWDLRLPAPSAHPVSRWHQEGAVLCLEQSDASPQTLLCGGRFNSVNLYDVRQSRLRRAIYSGSHMFGLASFNGGTVVGGGHDNKGRGVVEVFDVRTETVMSRLRGSHAAVVFGVSSNAPKYSRLATCSADGTVMLWDETGRRSLRYLMESTQPVTGVKMGETRVAVAYGDGVCVLDLGVEGRKWGELKGEENEEGIDEEDLVDETERRELASLTRAIDVQRGWARMFGGFGFF